MNIDAEVTADLVGDYLFTDEDFIRNLSAEHQNLFQKVYAEIKYLLKAAIAGSTEARKLEKVKKMFDKAYRESTEAQKNTTEDGGVRYSIVALDNGNVYVKASRNIITGTTKADQRKNITDFFNDLLEGNSSLDIQTIEGDVLTITKAETADKARDDYKTVQGQPVKMTDAEFLVKLRAEAHIDELAEISHKNNRPPVPDGKNHTFAKNGFTYRRAYFEDFDGQYYEITLSIGHNGTVATVYNVGKISKGALPSAKIIAVVGSKALGKTPSTFSLSKTTENVNTDFSLSTTTEDIAPVGNFNIHGWDIADIDAPIRDDIIIDTSANAVYNENRGDSYARTDEFRKLQTESQRMSAEEWNFYLRGGENEIVRRRISAVLQRQMDAFRSSGGSYDGVLTLSGKGNQFNIYEGVDPSLFHDIFEVSRKYLRNGELVDLHDVETTEDGVGYNDCYNYLSEDGLSGFSITPDGDLISVFNASEKGGFLRAISDVVKTKVKTLDCYASPNQNLMEMYQKTFGFKTASVMDYNMEYDHDNIAENHNKPKVAFMVNSDADVELREFGKDAYDEALAYRNSFLDQAANNELSVVHDVSEKIRIKVKNLQTELDNNQRLREESSADYEAEIARLQSEYEAKKNKTTRAANDLLRRIERMQRLKNNVDADYASRISDLKGRIEKMSTPTYKMAAQRKAKQGQYTALVEELVGDTSTWVDKKLGLSYKVNTLRRNLRDIVRDANGNKDTARADAIYDELQGNYNRNEAELKRESRRIKAPFAEMKLNKDEDAYAHMLGELWYNPQTTLTEDVVKDFFNKNQGNIDVEKVDNAIKERSDMGSGYSRRGCKRSMG